MNNEKELAKKVCSSDEFAEIALRFADFFPSLIEMLNEYKGICEKYDISLEEVVATSNFIQNQLVPILEASEQFRSKFDG